MSATPKSPPVSTSKVLVHSFGAEPSQELGVYLFADVLDEILFHATYRDEPATTLLLGRSYQSPEGQNFVEIQGFTEAFYGYTGQHLARIVPDYYARAAKDLPGGENAPRILGWSHSHRDQHATMTRAHALTHLSLFNLSDQIFLSIDPQHETIAVYGRTPQGSFQNLGFHLVSRRDKTLAMGFRPSNDLGAAQEEPNSPAQEDLDKNSVAQDKPVVSRASQEQIQESSDGETTPSVPGMLSNTEHENTNKHLESPQQTTEPHAADSKTSSSDTTNLPSSQGEPHVPDR